MDSRSRLWVGYPGELQALDTTGAVRVRTALDAGGPLRIVGNGSARLYVRAGDELLSVDEETGEVRMRRGEIGGAVVALDPRGRHLYLATEAGAVFGLHPRLLRPLWAWSRLGRRATAIDSSPEGDRLYLALAGEGDSPPGEILVRDVQTGRVLASVQLSGAVRELVVGPTGILFLVLVEDGGASLAALRPGPHGLTELWRHAPGNDAPPGTPQIRVSGTGGDLAAFVPGAAGLRVLDAHTGEVGLRTDDAPRDAAFGADGSLYLLFAEEIRVLRR
ncbi:MAG: PQQ-binding-like beta-propeller repeat protein [Gemmatimonadetes bacterium]|nr:PQQ-binding-like beta-propeller repeat protein [Gemmatimonadota bacterium]